MKSKLMFSFLTLMAISTLPALAGVSVSIQTGKDMAFVPATATVRAGQTVEWFNVDPETSHTVTFDPAKAEVASHVQLPAGVAPFDSGELKPGARFQHTFTAPGTYKYICQPHETMGMLGTLIVVP